MSEQGCTLIATANRSTANPPGVIRGCNCQTEPSTGRQLFTDAAGVHWLRGSIPMDEERRGKAYLDTFFGTERQERQWGQYFADRSLIWPCGATLHYHSTPDRASITRGRITLEVPGKALEQMDSPVVLSFLRGLVDLSFQTSRLDLFYDDPTRLKTPTQIRTLVYAEAGGRVTKHDFTGFRRITWRGIASGDARTSDELMFGARGDKGSGKYLRIYDKAMESHGRNPAVRYELELSDEKAQAAFTMLTHALLADAGGIVGALIGGCIDFKVRTGDAHLRRLRRYDWWQTIIDRLGRVKLRGKVPHKTIDKAAAWVGSQVAGNLQMIREAWGAERFFPWLVDIVDGSDRLRTAHYAALETYRRSIRGDGGLDIRALRDFADNVGFQLESPTDE